MIQTSSRLVVDFRIAYHPLSGSCGLVYQLCAIEQQDHQDKAGKKRCYWREGSIKVVDKLCTTLHGSFVDAPHSPNFLVKFVCSYDRPIPTQVLEIRLSIYMNQCDRAM